jgi:hypothetical protein
MIVCSPLLIIEVVLGWLVSTGLRGRGGQQQHLLSAPYPGADSGVTASSEAGPALASILVQTQRKLSSLRNQQQPYIFTFTSDLARFAPIAHFSPNACYMDLTPLPSRPLGRCVTKFHHTAAQLTSCSVAKQIANNAKPLRVVGQAGSGILRPSAGLLCISSCRLARR